MKKLQLQRYSAGQRSNHWAVVTCFVLAAVSGFALFHPALFWLTALVGGPQWARILHPYLGIAMFVLFLGLFLAFVGANIWRKEDSAWLGSAGKLVSEGNAAHMPPVGKYNGGQKLVFWLFALCLIVLLVTGALFWQAWFAPSVPIWLQRIAVVLHALAAFGRNGSGAALDRLGELALSRRAGLRRRALEAFRFAVAPEQARVRLTALLAAAPEDAIRRDLAEALARLR